MSPRTGAQPARQEAPREAPQVSSTETRSWAKGSFLPGRGAFSGGAFRAAAKGTSRLSPEAAGRLNAPPAQSARRPLEARLGAPDGHCPTPPCPTAWGAALGPARPASQGAGGRPHSGAQAGPGGGRGARPAGRWGAGRRRGGGGGGGVSSGGGGWLAGGRAG